MLYINILNVLLCACSYLSCFILWRSLYFMCLLRWTQIARDFNKVEHELLHNTQIIIHKHSLNNDGLVNGDLRSTKYHRINNIRGHLIDIQT